MPSEDQPDLNSLLVFAAVADAGGFTAAAERLGLAKSRVSLQVSRLETQLGVTLLARTTRRIALTDAGRALYADCIPALRGVQEALGHLRDGDAELSGTLRVACTVDQAVKSLAPALVSFTRLHPRLRVDLRASDQVLDMVKEGIDLSIRVGWLRDSSLRATRLAEFEQLVVAAPSYLERAGPLHHPHDLAAHDWVALTLLPTPLTWNFHPDQGPAVTVRVNARLRVDSAAALNALLIQGAGLSTQNDLDAAADLRAGRLVRVLPDWRLPRGGVFAVYPPALHLPPKVRAFVDHYREHLNRSRTDR